MIHIVMPMAGAGSRFAKDGYTLPKPLIKIYGKPFFYWSTLSAIKDIDEYTLDFIIIQEHASRFNLDQIITQYFPQARIHLLSEITSGAVVTSNLGTQEINDEAAVVFNDCDHLFHSQAFKQFVNRKQTDNCNPDGILLTFTSNDPKYSYVRTNRYGRVLETVEKRVVSNQAICGCYYFKNINTFRHHAHSYLQDCDYQEFFMSGLYNNMIKNQCFVKAIPVDFHLSFGTPTEYQLAKRSTLYQQL